MADQTENLLIITAANLVKTQKKLTVDLINNIVGQFLTVYSIKKKRNQSQHLKDLNRCAFNQLLKEAKVGANGKSRFPDPEFRLKHDQNRLNNIKMGSSALLFNIL